jgi:hypothetical protein
MNDPLDALLKMIGDTALFPPNSRYHAVERALLEQSDGRKLPYLRRRFLPQPGRLALLVEHSLNEGDRLDNLSAQYLTDAELFWRICDANHVLHPAEATRQAGERLRIPVPGNPTGSEDG